MVEARSAIADTFAGRVHVEWDAVAPVTPFGQLAFFIEPDLLGTVLLSVLAGGSALCAHHRAALRSDEPVVAWHAQGCQRGFGAPRLGNDWRGKRAALVAKPSGLLHRTVAKRAMGARYEQHREDLIRA